MNSEERVKKLVELRSYLQTRIKELEDETNRLNMLLQITDEVIVAKSFLEAEEIETAPKTLAPEQIEEIPKILVTEESEKGSRIYLQSIPLKTKSGVILANMYIGESDIRIVPATDQTFNVNTPPFQAFMITRILEPMQERDREATRREEVAPEKAFLYQVVQDEEAIKEIVIKNYGDERHLIEIKSSLRWTLEKMWEKIHKQNP